MAAQPVRFVHISDSHLRDPLDFEEHGQNPHVNLRAVVAAIEDLSPAPHFVIHSGDVVTDDTDLSYRHAADIMSRLSVPFYCAMGNHDDRDLLRKHLTMGPHTSLTEETLCYRFAMAGECFLVLDSRHPHGGGAGLLSEEQLTVVSQHVSDGDDPVSLFIHHPPIDTDCKWMKPLELLNLQDLHNLLAAAPARIRGVYSGHIHRGSHTTRDGISYTTVPATWAQLNMLPADLEPVWAEKELPGFNYVTILENSVLVRKFAVPVGASP